jgi:hypothetical protein
MLLQIINHAVLGTKSTLVIPIQVQGRIQGADKGGAPGARPSKIGKNDFLA